MKKLLIAAAFLYAGFGLIHAQAASPEEDKDQKTWYHKNYLAPYVTSRTKSR